MTGTPYPVVIAAIKKWIGGHMTVPAQSIEVDGQPVMRKSGFGDLVSAALSELISGAVSGGMALLQGGTKFGEFAATLPGPVQSVLADLKTGLNTIKGWIPDGVGNTFANIQEVFINPVAGTISGFYNGIVNGATEAGTVSGWVDPSNTTMRDRLIDANAMMLEGGAVYGNIENFENFSNQLSGVPLYDIDGITPLPSTFKVSDAISVVNSGPGNILGLLNITEVPKLENLVGTLIHTNLHDNLTDALINHDAKLLTLKGLLTPPTIETIGSGQGATTRTIYTPPSPAAQAAYNDWDASFTALKETSAALNAQVESDKANIRSVQKEQEALVLFASLGTAQSEITDPDHLALYQSTLSPTALSLSTLSSNLLNTPTATVTVTPPLESKPVEN